MLTSLLFEPNRQETLDKFNALINPIMQSIQERSGVDRYKVVIDTTTTTQADVENNTIRGKIFLQPTRTAEFVALRLCCHKCWVKLTLKCRNNFNVYLYKNDIRRKSWLRRFLLPICYRIGFEPKRQNRWIFALEGVDSFLVKKAARP